MRRLLSNLKMSIFFSPEVGANISQNQETSKQDLRIIFWWIDLSFIKLDY
jgi:hypothetical protein